MARLFFFLHHYMDIIFSRDVFTHLKGENKDLFLIPDAVHTDLYDRTDVIPFDKLEAFFNQYLY